MQPSTARMTEPPSPSIMSRGSPSSRSSRSAPGSKRVVSCSASSSTRRPHHDNQQQQQLGHTRSSSRSTGRSGPGSRRSSRHSCHRRILTPSAQSRYRPDQRRENLLTLHRESCRLFQGSDAPASRPETMARAATAPTTTTAMSHAPSTTSSEIGSPPVSPGLYAHSSISEHSVDRQNPNYHIADTAPVEQELSPRKQPFSTVIDWTSPSTRRREYEKIDRASRGVRGLWRRVAPQWCQSKNDRMPFFDPGKSGKTSQEGSVRRFRMDLPDER